MLSFSTAMWHIHDPQAHYDSSLEMKFLSSKLNQAFYSRAHLASRVRVGTSTGAIKDEYKVSLMAKSKVPYVKSEIEKSGSQKTKNCH